MAFLSLVLLLLTQMDLFLVDLLTSLAQFRPHPVMSLILFGLKY